MWKTYLILAELRKINHTILVERRTDKYYERPYIVTEVKKYPFRTETEANHFCQKKFALNWGEFKTISPKNKGVKKHHEKQ